MMYDFKIMILIGLFSSVLAGIKEVTTGGEFVYTYFPMIGSTINFEVKTGFDANVMITDSSSPNLNTDPFLEIVVGGGSNREVVIRRRRPTQTANYEVVLSTPNIVSDKEFRGFWIKFVGDTVLFGRSSDKVPFVSWTDPKPFQRNYFGVSSCCGASAEWKIDNGAVDYEETPCAPLAIKSMELPFRTDQANATAKLVDGKCFDLLVHQCSTKDGARGNQIKAKGKKRYIIDEQVKSWDAAKKTCEGRGQTLASVRSEEEQQKLDEAIQNFSNPFSGVWIAANDRAHAGQFVWYDGTNDVMTYNNWASSSKNKDTDGKNCVFASYVSLVVKKQAHWYLQECKDTWNFACEVYE